MARTRDVVIGVIIGGTILVAVVFTIFLFIGMSEGFSGGDGFSSFTGHDRVGIVEVFGIIDEPMGRKIIADLDRWADNSSIKAIVLHINSPGGGSAISQEIYDAVLRIKAEKPVVASLASVAASGGYMVACGADRIVANSSTLTGSIGVIMQFHTFPELLDKIGVKTETIKSGQLKDVGSYAHEMRKDEELMLRSVVMDTYEQFVQVVATGRNMETDEVYPFADGSVFTGLQAFNIGLVDSLGGLKEAIDLATDLAGIDADAKVVRPYRRRKSTFFDLIGSLFGDIEARINAGRVGPSLLYLYQ